MSALLSILGFALLFVVFGVFRRRECGSDCGFCDSNCTYAESRNETT